MIAGTPGLSPASFTPRSSPRGASRGTPRDRCRKRDNLRCRSWTLSRVLATLDILAPLLGLLGTVAGMIDALNTFSTGGYATVTELSRRLQSLLRPPGLVVATPTFVAYSYLSSRVNTLMHEMERAGIEVVHMLTDREPMSDIITFQAPVEEQGR